jgi:transcriptional regulator with XRE-family HTH domain
MSIHTPNNLLTADEDLEYPETLEEFASQVRKKLAKLLLDDLHTQPVRDVGAAGGFGSWITSIRKQAHLTERDIAVALDLPEEGIRQICSDEFLPWASTPSRMADLMILFRLHLDAITKLQKSRDSQGVNVEIASTGISESTVPAWLCELREELLARHSEDLIN